ncbi:MAG: amino acid adenylation domain-containing protein, partial [Alcanivoracaceae bacterium]|nr:amino acid adenylation domain-containing protein [Alcanivoracaceae bacterium]
INFINNISLKPDCEIQKSSLLTQEGEQQQLQSMNSTQADYPSDLCIHHLFEKQLAQTPNNIAVTFEEQSLSYFELNVKANRLAHYLIKQGVKPDDIIGLCLERSLEMMIGIMAIWKAGAAYLPLDPHYPKNRLQHMIQDSHLSILLTQQKITAVTEGMSIQRLILDNKELLNTLSIYSVANPTVEHLTSRHLAYVIYTSGSTGLPKGVMVEHQAAINRIDWMQKQYKLKQNDVVLQKTPFSFDVSVCELTWFFTVGARLVMALPGGHKNPAYLCDVIQEKHITTIRFVPSMLRLMLANSDWAHCQTLRQVFCSGEALPADLPALHYEANDAVLYNLYGPTEAAVEVSYWQVPNKNNRMTIAIGKPIQNIQLLVLNEQLQLQPQGVAGELFIAGAGLARGYLNQPELTAQRFIQHTFSDGSAKRLYRTGDLARYLEDGNLEYIGRVDQQVKIRGFRIEPAEIEQQLTAHPDIDSSLVIVNKKAHEERLVAYLITKSSIKESQLIKNIRLSLHAYLPDYMVPSIFVILPQFPLTASGKIDRKALPEPDATFFSGKYVAPDGKTELILTAIWSGLLNIPQTQISANANFFELGGHSLLATKLINDIKEKMQLEIEYIDIFDFPILRNLSVAMDNKLKTDSLMESLAESNDYAVEELEW